MKLFNHLTSQTVRLRRRTEARLDEYNKPSQDFFVLISLASSLAVLGLALDNAAIVIGAMVVAPIITPIFGFSLGLIVARAKRVTVSLTTLLLGTLLSIVVTTITGLVVMFVEETGITVTDEILARAEPDLLFFLVAFVSGLIGAYAYARHDVAERIAGIAISVAVIPPLAVVGIGIALQDWTLATQSLWLYAFNLLGICFGSILMFVFLGFGKEIEKQ